MIADPWLGAIVVLVAVVVIACVWALVEARHAEPTVQPFVAAQPAIAPRCQAAHCGLPAFTTAPHVDGTDMWVCPDDLERGYRDGWLVPVVLT